MFRVGIIGCGRVVEDAHAPALSMLRDRATVVALADPSEERRRAVQSRLGSDAVDGHDSWKAMFDAGGLDAVVVAVPHHLHAPAIEDAAAAGVDVISEKPLANTLAEVDSIAEAVEAGGVRLSVMHNWAYTAGQQAALAAIAAGRIGTPFLSRNEAAWGVPWAGRDPAGDWRMNAAHAGGGIVITNAYHQLYIAEQEMRSPVVRVYASVNGDDARDGVESTAVIVFDHANGSTSLLARSWASVGGGQGVHEVHGSEGTIRFRPSDPAVTNRAMADHPAPPPAPGGPPPRPLVEIHERAVGEWRPLEVATLPWWDGIRAVFELTFDRWSAHEEAPAGIAEARRVLQLVHAIYRSAESGESVELAA